MSTPVICAYARTPFGRFRGALANYTAVELGTLAVKGVLQRAEIDPGSGIIDQVYMGQVLQAGVPAWYEAWHCPERVLPCVR